MADGIANAAQRIAFQSGFFHPVSLGINNDNVVAFFRKLAGQKRAYLAASHNDDFHILFLSTASP